MIVDHLELTVNNLRDVEESLVAHARYYACRQLLYQLLIRSDVTMPDFLKKEINNLLNLRSHDQNPMAQRIQQLLVANDNYKRICSEQRTVLDAAEKRIRELEKTNG